MSKIVLDADLRAKLNGGTERLDVTDENGNLVGRYWPHAAFTRFLEAFCKPMTADDVAEARREMLATGGASTEDMLAAIEDVKRVWDASR